MCDCVRERSWRLSCHRVESRLGINALSIEQQLLLRPTLCGPLGNQMRVQRLNLRLDSAVCADDAEEALCVGRSLVSQEERDAQRFALFSDIGRC